MIEEPDKSISRLSLALLAVILVAGAVARFIHLGADVYDTDEYWHAELSTGRGTVQDRLPMNQLFFPDSRLTRLAHAPPWWQIWTHMEVTVHPPLYPIALRFWRATFGEAEAASRSLGATVSLLSVLVLFDLVRRLHGTRPALWSAAIMSLASAQITLSRVLRGYAFGLLLILLAALVLVMIVQSERRRGPKIALLFFLWLAALLTHYFTAFALAALGIYAIASLRGRLRLAVVSAMFLSVVVFIAVWWPQMRDEIRTMPSGRDAWIADPFPGRVGRALLDFFSIPLRMLFEPPRQMAWLGAAGAVLFVAPALMLRRRHELLLWVLWLYFVSIPLLTIDLTRQTKHLSFVRYILTAGPPVYALLATLLANWRTESLRSLVPATTVLACALSINSAYNNPRRDFRGMAEFLDSHRQPRQPVIIFMHPGNWIAFITYLAMSEESRDFPWPTVVADRLPLDDRALDAIRSAGGAILIRDGTTPAPEEIIPGARMTDWTFIPYVGVIASVTADGKAAPTTQSANP